MDGVIGFIINALLFVTLPLFLVWQLVKWVKKGKPAKQWMIELCIIFFILFILAAIAIPDFLKFQAKAKASESQTNLGQIFFLQYKYKETFGHFAGGPDAFSYLDWKPSGINTHSYFCGDDFIPNSRQRAYPRIGREWRPAAVGSSDTGFTCAAVGNIDNDPALDFWLVNDQRVFINEPSDLEH